MVQVDDQAGPVAAPSGGRRRVTVCPRDDGSRYSTSTAAWSTVAGTDRTPRRRGRGRTRRRRMRPAQRGSRAWASRRSRRPSASRSPDATVCSPTGGAGTARRPRTRRWETRSARSSAPWRPPVRPSATGGGRTCQRDVGARRHPRGPRARAGASARRGPACGRPRRSRCSPPAAPRRHPTDIRHGVLPAGGAGDRRPAVGRSRHAAAAVRTVDGVAPQRPGPRRASRGRVRPGRSGSHRADASAASTSARCPARMSRSCSPRCAAAAWSSATWPPSSTIGPAAIPCRSVSCYTARNEKARSRPAGDGRPRRAGTCACSSSIEVTATAAEFLGRYLDQLRPIDRAVS